MKSSPPFMSYTPGPNDPPLIDAPQVRPGADRPYGVEMAEQQHPDPGPFPHDPQQRAVVGQHRRSTSPREETRSIRKSAARSSWGRFPVGVSIGGELAEFVEISVEVF